MTPILPEPARGFRWTVVPHAAWDGHVLRCEALAARADHFFTTRPLRLRGEDEEVARDWARVATAIGVPGERLWRMRQVHGCDVAAVASPMIESAQSYAAQSDEVQSDETRADAGQADTPRADAPQADALIADDPAGAIAVQVADCVPLLFADVKGRVAATHAGWRGAAANIVRATVRELGERYGVRPEDLVAAVGPSIGPCCYQVGPDVRAAFLDSPAALPRVERWFRPDAGDRLKLDMWQATIDQLIEAGVPSAQIHVARLCTACHVAQLYSYRVEGVGTGRMVGVIRARA